MKIDNDIEPLVREAFAASVTEQPDRFGDALAQIDRDDDTATKAFALA
jgi:hypothetical protein